MSIASWFRRGFAMSCIAVLACVGCRPPETGGSPSAGALPTGIVLVTVDGLIGDELSLFGGPTATPALEHLAESGTAWRDGWTTSPVSRSALASYLTGLAPDRHGVRDDLVTALEPDFPTVATALSARGYETAAFPDSSFLGLGSGLLRGFDVVDDPPGLVPGLLTWQPTIKPPEMLADDFVRFVEELPEERPYFAWVHFSSSSVFQMYLVLREHQLNELPERVREAGEGSVAEPPDSPVLRVDEAIGKIVAAVDARDGLARSAIIVAGTSGDLGGSDEQGEMAGPGFSLYPRALRVPIVARFPHGAPARAPDQTVWVPDVAVTLARVGGGRLGQAEGIDLLDEVEADRTLFSWSWAPRDQLGWSALRSARSGETMLIVGDRSRMLDLEGRPVDAPADALSDALAGRSDPPPPSVPLEVIRPLLERQEIAPEPIPGEGRPFPAPEIRVELAKRIWVARSLARTAGRVRPRWRQHYLRVLELDPENLTGLLGLGQYDSLTGMGGMDRLSRAAQLYPDHTEVLHWYAHGLWKESWEDAERFLEAILPFKMLDADVRYDLACARSLAGDLDASEQHLREAIAAGYRVWDHMEADPDLRNLRESGRFAEVLRDYR